MLSRHYELGIHESRHSELGIHELGIRELGIMLLSHAKKAKPLNPSLINFELDVNVFNFKTDYFKIWFRSTKVT